MIDPVQIDDRISKCQKILDLDPNSQIFAALAEAYRKKGELEKAFRICQSGLKIHPSYGSAHIVMAKINLDRGLYDWAETEIDKAAKIDGRTRSVELLMAEISIYKGEFDRAIKLLTKLSQTDPDNSQIKKLLEIARKLPEEQRLLTGGTEPESQKAKTASEDTVVPETSTSSGALDAKDVMERGIKIPGIDGVLAINLEGLVLESEWTMKLDSSVCGAAMSEIGNILDRELVRSSFGGFRTILIETASTTFYLVKISGGLFLFVANASVNLGTLRMKIENLLVSYRQV